jgi:hypothetical protein
VTRPFLSTHVFPFALQRLLVLLAGAVDSMDSALIPMVAFDDTVHLVVGLVVWWFGG